MKHFKIILILFFALSFSSCNVTQRLEAQKFEDRMYNYGYIHQLYITNPTFFHYQTYYDAFGNQYYYYQHPYYIRYCRERNIIPYYPSNQNYINRGRSNQNYNGNRQNTNLRRTNTVKDSRGDYPKLRRTNTRVKTTPVNRTRVNTNTNVRRQNTTPKRGG